MGVRHTSLPLATNAYPEALPTFHFFIFPHFFCSWKWLRWGVCSRSWRLRGRRVRSLRTSVYRNEGGYASTVLCANVRRKLPGYPVCNARTHNAVSHSSGISFMLVFMRAFQNIANLTHHPWSSLARLTFSTQLWTQNIFMVKARAHTIWKP